MSMTMVHERGKLYRVEIRGVLKKSDLDRCQAELSREIARVGPVRLLIALMDFSGWEPYEDWNDLTFYVKHGDAVERIAIVGDERWRGEALMFAAADLRKGPVQFFPTPVAADARVWLDREN